MGKIVNTNNNTNSERITLNCLEQVKDRIATLERLILENGGAGTDCVNICLGSDNKLITTFGEDLADIIDLFETFVIDNKIVEQSGSTYETIKMISKARIAFNCIDSRKKRNSEKTKNKAIYNHYKHISKSSHRDVSYKQVMADKSIRKHIFEQGLFPDVRIDLGPESLDVFEKLNDTLDDISHKGIFVNHGSDFIQPLADKMGELKALGYPIYIMLSLLLAKYCFDKIGNTKISILIITILCTIHIMDADVLDILKKIRDKVRNSISGIEPQGYTESLSQLIIMYMYSVSIKKSLNKEDASEVINSFFKSTADMKKVRDGADFTIGQFLKLSQKFFDHVCSFFGAERIRVAADNIPELTVFAEDVDEISREFMKGKIMNFSSAEKINQLYLRGQKLNKFIPYGPEYQEARRMLSNTLMELHPLVLKLKRTNVYNNGPRVEPVGIFLTGPPGVGKTTALIPMMLAVTAQVLPEHQLKDFQENHEDFVFNRVSENVFFDNYHGQFNTFYDDLGQVRDVAGNAQNPYMEVIRMINSNSYDLHMAHLEDKGNVNFRSRLVWATSNVKKFALNSIIDSSALCRRFRCSFLVVPKPEYCVDPNVGSLWERRLKPACSIENFEHLEFYNYDIFNGKVIMGETHTMSEVIQHIVNVYNNNDKTGSALIGAHQKIKEQYIAQRVKPQHGDDIMDHPVFGKCMFTYNDMAKMINVSAEFIEANVSKVREVGDLYDIQRILVNEDDFSGHLKALNKASSSYLSWLSEKVKKTCEKHSTVIKASAAISAMIGGLYLGYNYFSSFIKDEQSSVRSSAPKRNLRADREGFKLRRGRVAGKGHRQLRGHRGDDEEQLAYDATTFDILRKVYRRSMYVLTIPGSTKASGYVTFIRAHDAIMPLHFMERIYGLIESGVLSDDVKIKLASACAPDSSFEIAVSDLEVFYPENMENDDICFVRFPNILPVSPDLTRYFLDDFSVCDNKFTGAMLLPRDGGSNIVLTQIVPTTNIKYTDYECVDAFQYDIPTMVGDCGSLLAIANPNTRSAKIIGMHVAGSGRKGYSIRVSRTMIEDYLSCVSEPHVIDEEGYFDIDEITESSDDAFFVSLYNVPKPSMPTKTNIIPSPLHGVCFESKCKPAHLTRFKNPQGEWIDPWASARSNYAKRSFYLCEKALKACTQSYLNHCIKSSLDNVGWLPRVFTFEEAVAGLPGVDFCDGIPRGTSAGYPWVLSVPKNHHGKTHFFGTDGQYDFDSTHCKVLQERVRVIVDKASQGVRLKHFYMDVLKDERRPIEKVDQGKTRMISAGPVDHLICLRMYFMDFVRWFMSNRLRNGSAVGINAYSDEWHMFARMLGADSGVDNIIAGDFSKFDASINRRIQIEFLEMVNQWYNDGNDRIRAVLFEDVCNSKHVVGSLGYMWPGSNPSGCFLTTILNTVSNNIIIRYASLLCKSIADGNRCSYPKMDLSQISKELNIIERNVYIVAFGDDNIISVGKDCRDYINQTTLTESFAQFGFTYTLETKDGAISKNLRNITEVNFLKRNFRYERAATRYISPLSLDTITEMIQWTKKKDIESDFVRTNITNALKELSFHGEETYNRYAPTILKKARTELDFIPEVVSWDHNLALQLSRDDFCT